MKRKAILLAASTQHTLIEELFSALARFQQFLRSNQGGAWDAAEITLRENPDRQQVLSAVDDARNADYSLVLFIGSGELKKTNLPWKEAHMQLNSGDSITEREINPGSSRCTLIIDCCFRSPQKVDKTPLEKPFALTHSNEDASVFRNSYDKGLAAAESGLVKVYAMATSGITTDTSSFTQSLLDTANAWAAKNKGTLFLGDAVALAKEAMKRENSQQQQQLEYHGGRRLRQYPLAVQI